MNSLTCAAPTFVFRTKIRAEGPGRETVLSKPIIRFPILSKITNLTQKLLTLFDYPVTQTQYRIWDVRQEFRQSEWLVYRSFHKSVHYLGMKFSQKDLFDTV